MGKIITDIDIANQALGYLGEQRISTMTEGTNEARAISLHFLQCLEELIESRRWSFGRSRQRLTQEEDKPLFGFKYSFQLPGDCLKVMDVMALAESGETLNPIPIRNFEIEGRSLHSDYPYVGLVYVKESISSDLPPLMIRALVMLLAARVAPSLGESRMAMTLEAKAEDAIQDAWLSDVRQNRSGENSTFQKQSREWMSRVRGISDHCCDNEYFPLSGGSDDPDDGGGTDPPVNSPPDPVSGLGAIPSDGEILVNWVASPGATSYVVSLDGVEVTPEPTLPTYNFTGLENGRDYLISVSAKNEFGTSDPVTITEAPELSIPDPVTGLSITPGDEQLTISWISSSKATSYVVIVGGVTVTPEPTASPYVAMNLVNNQDYAVSVAAKNAAGTSSAVVGVGRPSVSMPNLNDVMISNVASLLATQTEITEWSTYDPENAGGPVYVHNPNALSYPIREALTGNSPYSDDGNPGTGAGTMITPWHGVTAGHNKPNAGQILHFVDMDGNAIVRTVAVRAKLPPDYNGAGGQRQNDYAVFRLDAPVDITKYKPATILPTNWRDYLSPLRALQTPIFKSNQVEEWSLLAFRGLWIDTVTHPDGNRQIFGGEEPTNPVYTPYYVDGATGDSSSPIGFVLDGQFILLACTAGRGSGHPLHIDEDDINALIRENDDDVGLTGVDGSWPNDGTYYQVKVEDFTGRFENIPLTAPSKPVFLSSNPGDEQVTVSLDNSEDGVRYQIYDQADPTTILFDGEQITNIVITGLTNDQTYNLIAVCINDADTSEESDPEQVTPFSSGSVPADIPGLTSFFEGDEVVTASWAGIPGATGYRVYRDGNPTPVYDDVAPSFGDSGLTNNQAYSYAFVAVNAIGESANPYVQVLTPRVSAPADVTGLTITPGDGQLTISWDVAAGATSYGVLIDGSPVTPDPTGTTHIETGLTNGQTYNISVVGRNASGDSPNPALGTGTPATAESFFRGTAAVNSYMQIPSSGVTLDDWVEIYAIIRSDDWTTNNDDDIHSTIISGFQSFPMWRVRATGGYLQAVLSTSIFNTDTEVSAMPQTSDWYEVRIRRIDSANWEFHYKVEGAGSWVLAGTWANTTTDSDNTTLYFGSRDNNDANSDMGIKLVRYRSGTDENNLNTDIEIDCRAVTPGSSSFTATTGETVTVSSPGVITDTWT